jgi:hypothetical protein
MDNDIKSRAEMLPKPPAFKLVTAVVVLQAILAFVGFKPTTPYGLPAAIGISITYAICFWKGYNWARKLVILVSAATFVFLYFDVMKHNMVWITRDLIELPLALFLLYWLNIRPVRQYFGRR